MSASGNSFPVVFIVKNLLKMDGKGKGQASVHSTSPGGKGKSPIYSHNPVSISAALF
jgi:hypothetical protein